VNLFVDTSVWSLAWRCDTDLVTSEVGELRRALSANESIYTTGLVLQEVLQRFSGPKSQKQIIERFAALPLLSPDRQDYIQAAELRNDCRCKGIR
jgi:predicted nucleic acid-binding protein